MIVREYFKTRSDEVKLFRTYSDAGEQIVQNETGIIYTEAIDVEDAPFTYSEVVEYREIPESIPPEEAFSINEKGWWKGELYTSLYDNQTWNPEQFAAGWSKI